MSRYGLVPMSFNNWWREPRDIWDLAMPSRLFDQRFGQHLSVDDLLPPSSLSQSHYVRPRRLFNRQMSGLSEVKTDGNKFQVDLDVNQFSPAELTVKTVDNSVVVHGKHEEKVDEHGFVSREFTRRYVLPEGVIPETVVSSLSPDGVLTIEAPMKALEAPKPNERIVSIGRTNAAAPAVADKPAEKAA